MSDDLRAFSEELNRRFEGMANLIAHLQDRMDERFERIEKRMERLEQRMDRLENRMTALEFQMAGMNRTLDESGRTVSGLIAAQTAQQKTIDDLAARVARLEQERQQRQ